MEVRVDLLGPLRVLVDGAEVSVPGPKRRCVLAVLVSAECRVVPVDELIDALWPAHVPETAMATLHSHVSRLRRHLGSAAERLERIGGGYRLALGATETDLGEARSLLERARAAEPEVAVRLLTESRTLWRGDPFAEFPDVAALAAVVVNIASLRWEVDRALVEALIEAGHDDAAVSLASQITATEPLSEPSVVLLVRALHSAGRSADALRAAYDFRRRLVTTAGLEPSPALRDVEARVAGDATPAAGAVPRAAHRLRGRETELAVLRQLVVSERVVTVVGAGGVGKTRLAIEVASEHDPVTAVLLGAVADGADVPQAIADALALRVLRGDVVDACAAILAAGPRLLLLDGCEHVLSDVRSTVVRLVEACPELVVLATSREPLGLAVEQRLRLASLPVLDTAVDGDRSLSPAAAVFVDRAARIRPELTFDEGDMAAVSEIVRRLDGMPLAIELAAARLSSLGLDDLVAQLDDALDALGDARGDTLRHTVAWSYDLLPRDEQRLLCHLSVFVDGVDLEVATTIARELAPGSVPLRTLGHLVDASVLEMAAGRSTRYRMLDTVRAYALERLTEDGEIDRATERFIRWLLDLARLVGQRMFTADEAWVDDTLRRELPNLRAGWRVVRWLGRTEDAIAVVVRLFDAASWRDLTEIRDWSLELAADPGARCHPRAPELLGLAAASAWFRGELDRADELADAGIDAAGEDWSSLDAKALVALARGELRACRRWAVAAGEAATRPAESFGIAALAAAYDGDGPAALALNERFGSVATSPTLDAFHEYVAGEIDALAGLRADAIERYENAIDIARSVGSTFVEGVASVGRLSQFAQAGETATALAGYRELIDYWERTGAWVQQWTTLRNLADVLQESGDTEAAAFLRAAASVAPDAPPVPTDRGVDEGATPLAGVREDAMAASRGRVLDVARTAIAAALTIDDAS